MTLRSTVLVPEARAKLATCSLVAASSSRTVAEVEPPPLGLKTFIVAVRERHALTTRPEDGPIVVVAAPPEGEKLTGACMSSTLSSTGAPAGVESRACQRTPCTVRRKFNASVELETVTGK